ncbi:TDRKH protein, partial [Sclerurus mexicanus]|nr:TDRKH protein [Sclerurus mexicanus]
CNPSQKGPCPSVPPLAPSGPPPIPGVPPEVPVTYVGDEGLELEVKVPRRAMKCLIGRRGATINQLRRDTGAHIAVEEQEEEEQREESLVRIWGSPSQVCRAKAAVLRIVADSTPVAEQLRVPHRAVGRIIGRGGETVRGICRSSGARVDCGRDPDSILAPIRVIQLSGTRKEVEAAKRLILEKLSEDAAFRRELAQAAAARCPRKQPLGSRRDTEPLPGGVSEQWELEWAREGSEEPEETKIGKEEVEDRNEELEELENGNELEELENGNEEPSVPKFEEGGNEEPEGGNEPSCSPGAPLPPSLVHPTLFPVCPTVPSPDFSFPADEHLEVYVSAVENPGHFWIQILGNRSLQLDKLTAEMRHFYGTSPAVRPLGPHGVPPCHSSVPPGPTMSPMSPHVPLSPGAPPVGSGWEEAALQEFERLTHCAQWTPLVAQISSYSQSGLCSRPSVRLFAHHHGQSLDVGAELIRLGYAVPRPPKDEEGPGG